MVQPREFDATSIKRKREKERDEDSKTVNLQKDVLPCVVELSLHNAAPAQRLQFSLI